jgi:hypothetical protein
MTDIRLERVADWLTQHPAPIHLRDVAAWTELVAAELGNESFPSLLALLADGDAEQQYQAMAAARVLGAEVWADGREPDQVWRVTLPGEQHVRHIRPRQQLAG